MSKFFTKPWLRVLSGLFINLAAGWFGVAIITPNFVDIFSFNSIFALTMDLLFGIIFILTAVKIEERLES